MIDKFVIKEVKKFERSHKEFISFWERLDITIDDVLKPLSINTNTTIGRMFKSIKEQSALYALLPQTLGIDAAYVFYPKKRNEKLKEIFKSNMEAILNSYFCVLFAEVFQYPRIWDENNVLSKNEISQIKGNFAARAYLTYKKDKSKLNDVYNSVVMLRNEQKKYRILTKPEFKGQIHISGDKFEKVLNRYEKARKNHRNRIRVWWEKDGGDEYNIVFRRSLSKSIRVPLFNRNKFIGATTTKTYIITKDIFLSTFSAFQRFILLYFNYIVI